MIEETVASGRRGAKIQNRSGSSVDEERSTAPGSIVVSSLSKHLEFSPSFVFKVGQ